MKLLLSLLLLDIAVVTCSEFRPDRTWKINTCPWFLWKSPNAKIEIEKILEECKKGNKRLKRTCKPEMLEWIKEKKVSTSQTWDQGCTRFYRRRN